MVGKATLLLLGAGLAALVSLAPQQPSALAEAQPGLWEISGAPGIKAPVRQCIADVATLARFEHRARSCTARIVKSGGMTASIEYSCGGAGFGHSDLEFITPRSLRISTQRTSAGLPFNYVLQARRVDDCTKSASVMHH